MEWTNEEIDVHVDELVQKALVALEKFESFNQETVDYIVAKCSVAGLDQHGVLAEAAVKETGRGETYTKLKLVDQCPNCNMTYAVTPCSADDHQYIVPAGLNY